MNNQGHGKQLESGEAMLYRDWYNIVVLKLKSGRVVSVVLGV